MKNEYKDDHNLNEGGSLLGDDGTAYLSDVSPKDKPWDVHKANADIVSSLYSDSGLDKLAERSKNCAKFLLFALAKSEDSDRIFVLENARFCRLRHCPICQWRRSLMWKARFHKISPQIKEKYPSHRFILLTLTVRNCPIEELRSNVTAINKAWERLSKRKAFPAIGWIKSIEVTRGEDGSAHPHIHAILMVNPSYFSGKTYISQEKWRLQWQSAMRIDYDPRVNVQAIKGDDLTVKIPEVVKYTVKESDLIADSEWLKTLTEQLHKTRAIAIGGVFREFLSEDEPEDLIHTDSEETETEQEDPRINFGWREKTKRYRSQ